MGIEERRRRRTASCAIISATGVAGGAGVELRGDERGSVRRAMPVSGFISQWPWSVAFSQLTRPLRWSSLRRRPGACPCFAQATWREPGPWHASHDTSTSDQVVA